MMTFGYIFEDEDERVLYSGDTGNPTLLAQYLFENPSPKKTRIFHELTFFQGVKAHCYYKDLVFLAEKYEVYGYHLDKKYAPADNPIPLVEDFPELLMP
jgi:ribonuclease BN (tRNA processing enzyme)